MVLIERVRVVWRGGAASFGPASNVKTLAYNFHPVLLRTNEK
jgi:hypothetical protein